MDVIPLRFVSTTPIRHIHFEMHDSERNSTE